jgi:hypothetical protein
MTNTMFYVLHNEATGRDTNCETLIDALDAVDGSVGSADDWVVHQVCRGSVTRFVTEGCGRNSRHQ